MNECQPSALFLPLCSLMIPFPGNGPLTIRIGLHKSVNSIKIMPCGNGQRLVSQVILDSVKLPVNTAMVYLVAYGKTEVKPT